MRSRLSESEPPLDQAGQHSDDGCPQAPENQDAGGSAGEVQRYDSTGNTSTQGSDAPPDQSASGERSKQQYPSAWETISEG